MPNLASLLQSLENHPYPKVELKLERMRQFLARVGNPERHLPPIIHVAGTNGKGSVLAFLHAMIAAGGKSAHRYTSPHLVSFHERYILANHQIDDATLVAGLERLTQQLADFPLTYFESATALAFQLFAETLADFTLLEVGLGGRLDATNVIEHPAATIIMPISLDHQDMLGNTIAAIAYEKACIMKAGVPCVVGHQPAEAMRVIEKYAAEISAPLFRLGKEWHYDVTAKGELHYQSNTLDIITPPPALIGQHQYGNAATAIVCADLLQLCSADAMKQGIASAQWAGRLQRIHTSITHHHVYLDGGHNASAAETISDWIAVQHLPVHVVLGMHHDKDASAVIASLMRHAASMSVVTITGDPKALSSKTLAEMAHRANYIVTPYASLSHAITSLTVTKDEQEIILVTGSLYLVGEALSQLVVCLTDT
jgi:dihydrofolate synthase / folylpolyglutamate synthase